MYKRQNLHRAIKPEQSQIWAVLRVEDSDARLHYSLAATLLGRMCLSGDIHGLSQHQWDIVEEGMDFYRKAAEIIQKGVTVLHQCEPQSYNPVSYTHLYKNGPAFARPAHFFTPNF